MAVRSEEVADRIDAHIRESIEKMVAEIRTSVDDVREAVNQQLDAALQSVQADVKSVSFRQHINKAISEFETEVSAAAPATAAARPDSSQLRSSIQAIESGKSQVDILNALLDQATNFSSRAALLILKGDAFSGWKGVGFSSHGGNDETIKRFSQPASEIAELDEVLHDERVVATDGKKLASRFGVTPPSRAIVIPMVIKDKIAAALYADAVDGDDRFDDSSLQLLVFTTGLLIDTLAIRKKIPSPSIRSGSPAEAAAPAPAPPRPAASAPAPQPQVAPPPVVPRPAPTPAPAPAPEPAVARPAAASPSFQLDEGPELPTPQIPKPKPAPAPVPSADAFATSMMPALKSPVAAAATAAPAPTVAELGERSSTQYIPPAGLTGGARFGSQQSDETKKHDEARRFARLLVSEIKLYNEAKVEQGRKNKDLYERLKEDIDRSRQMYEERIPEDVRKKSNYFYDELVRILADGDAASLGL